MVLVRVHRCLTIVVQALLWVLREVIVPVAFRVRHCIILALPVRAIVAWEVFTLLNLFVLLVTGLTLVFGILLYVRRSTLTRDALERSFTVLVCVKLLRGVLHRFRR